MSEKIHIPVLAKELIFALNPQPGQIIIDCTAGLGGHLSLVLDKILPSGQLIALDRDPSAIAYLREIKKEETKLSIIKSKFSQLPEVLTSLDISSVAAIYADIGVSSPQLDEGDRGFSFQKESRLDMRMDQHEKTEDAEEIINKFSETQLRSLFWQYGEEKKAAAFARLICAERVKKPIQTTTDLVLLARKIYPYSQKNPATKIFQALRIEVNKELEELEFLLEKAPSFLQPQGKLAVISFHSLEDRIVKNKFKQLTETKLPNIDPKIPLTKKELDALSEKPQFRLIKPFPILPSQEECSQNPRSRSAKLRVIEKIDKLQS